MVEQSQQPGEMPIPLTAHVLLPREQRLMPIAVRDWDSLTQRIESCKAVLQPWSIASSVSFGVGATAGLSIAPIAYAQLPWWVLTVYICFCGVGLVSGIIFAIAEKSLGRLQQTLIDGLVSDMVRTRTEFAEPAR